MKNFKYLIAVIVWVELVAIGWLLLTPKSHLRLADKINKQALPTAVNTPILPTPTANIAVTPTIISTESATKKPLSPEEQNKLFGPCTKVDILYYHHIQERSQAKDAGAARMSVSPQAFRKQMEYLKNHNYSVITAGDLANFFDFGTKLPAKSAIITLDDAYEDNYTIMYPILKEFGYKATIFTPTGLVQNPDYLTWDQITEMASSGLVYFANHTWSHHSSAGSIAEQEKEIGTADNQLNEKGLNKDKIFAYPFGNPSKDAELVLAKLGYKIGFTTQHGNMMCKGKRYVLPRLRIGDADLNAYGM